jgi:hypothetical protein
MHPLKAATLDGAACANVAGCIWRGSQVDRHSHGPAAFLFRSLHCPSRDELRLGLQNPAYLKVQSYVLIPAVKRGITFGKLLIHTADGRAFVIDAATFAHSVIVPTGAVATVKKSRFRRQVDVLAAQAALGTGKGVHGHQALCRKQGARTECAGTGLLRRWGRPGWLSARWPLQPHRRCASW